MEFSLWYEILRINTLFLCVTNLHFESTFIFGSSRSMMNNVPLIGPVLICAVACLKVNNGKKDLSYFTNNMNKMNNVILQ